MGNGILELSYLLAGLSFILGLKMLSNPETAKRGNLIAAGGMGLAVFATIFLYTNAEGQKLHNYGWIFGGLAIGTVAGTIAAKRVQMTAMPQMVSFFNGMGGACAAVISLVEFRHYADAHPGQGYFNGEILIILLGLIIGSVSFAGSIIAYGKLEGKIKDLNLKVQQILNIGLLLGLLVIAGTIMLSDGDSATLMWFYLLFGLSLLYGVLFVMPIGGADMPVVISLLNSFTGVAAACGGFLYDNKAMLVGGILVGSAGTLLTLVMTKAMNRSLANVLIGNFGGSSAGSSAAVQGSIREISVSDSAVLMKYSRKVIIIPGYGLAVAQAQHVCHELEELLEREGVEVVYAIHPVAGRMPGHMNVLLAESNVAYDKLVEMEEVNAQFAMTDVVLVIGANDVVNPAARTDTSSPIYGMPILDADHAKNIIVMKRSMGTGYAGIENPLFFDPKTRMLFGDAKKTLTALVNEMNSI